MSRSFMVLGGPDLRPQDDLAHGLPLPHQVVRMLRMLQWKNGWHEWREPPIRDQAQRLRQIGFRAVHTSLDGVLPENHGTQRQPNRVGWCNISNHDDLAAPAQ